MWVLFRFWPRAAVGLGQLWASGVTSLLSVNGIITPDVQGFLWLK